MTRASLVTNSSNCALLQYRTMVQWKSSSISYFRTISNKKHCQYFMQTSEFFIFNSIHHKFDRFDDSLVLFGIGDSINCMKNFFRPLQDVFTISTSRTVDKSTIIFVNALVQVWRTGTKYCKTRGNVEITNVEN